MFTDSTYPDRFFRMPSGRRTTIPWVGSFKAPTVASKKLAPRFLLWVDAVGGYLVSFADEVILGQPASGVDVPILADLSRRHAKIRRDGEGYLIEPLCDVRLDGRKIHERCELVDGTTIDLGETVQLRFRRPHPLSTTARLDFLSHHRTQPSADAVLLMADVCVLGPKTTDHCFCRDWPEEVFLFRQGNDLHCRTDAAFEIDGHRVRRRGPITYDSRIAGEHFSLSLEKV